MSTFRTLACLSAGVLLGSVAVFGQSGDKNYTITHTYKLATTSPSGNYAGLQLSGCP